MESEPRKCRDVAKFRIEERICRWPVVDADSAVKRPVAEFLYLAHHNVACHSCALYASLFER